MSTGVESDDGVKCQNVKRLLTLLHNVPEGLLKMSEYSIEITISEKHKKIYVSSHIPLLYLFSCRFPGYVPLLATNTFRNESLSIV